MSRRPINLSAHINQTVERGHPADFPVALKPLYYSARGGGGTGYIANRRAVVREDTGETLGIVSARYKLIEHQRLLDLVHRATAQLDVGPVPRGIYVDRGGGRMRALFKFPALAQSVYGSGDEICPCIKIQNTYDTTSRIMVHIGAFRFVCTNLAVGGGGVFAGGFMAVHAGEIPIEKIAQQLGEFLSGFEQIVETYRSWIDLRFDPDRLGGILKELPTRAREAIGEGILTSGVETVYSAYNIATGYATHRMRSAHTAFDTLKRINRGFQRQFPIG